MPRVSSPSRDKETYRYGDQQIEVLPYFLYEVSVYIIRPRRASMLLSRMYTSNKELKVKEAEIVKQTRNYTVMRYINLLGAPKEFIEENNLPKYELYSKRKKTTKK